jgi:hopanoid biosynthesis associated radical SAM protein HpnH
MDGQEEHHDFAVCREGVYRAALEAIRLAVSRGFRVTTNTTLFDGADPNSIRAFFDDMMQCGVEGMMLSPGYAYDKAPDQKSFLQRQRTNELFRLILSNRPRKARPGAGSGEKAAATGWRFNQSPLFLEFLMGRREYECTPWGNPTYNIFGWQKPCYLLQDGYADTFAELMEATRWDRYGHASGNPRCANCMVHSGYEASAVRHTFESPGGLWGTVRALLFSRYPDDEAARRLEQERSVPHGPLAHLVQIGLAGDVRAKGAA